MRKFVSFITVLFLSTSFVIFVPGGIQRVEAETKPTVYICGDSTVQSYSASYAPQAGWGQMIAKYFTADVLFVNRAIAGRSSKSFAVEGRLDSIINVIQPNDYLFVQFGHNDATISKPERYAEANTTYKEYLREYIDKARSKNAIPVLITPVARLNYSNGVYKNDFPAYCTAMKEVAIEKKVACIDLMTNSISYYNTLTFEQVKNFYMVSSNGTDYTHFTEAGATQIARIVAEGVKALNLPISKCVINVSSAKPVVLNPNPSDTPTVKPTNTPTNTPTNIPTNIPKSTPTTKPTNTPTIKPTVTPTDLPTPTNTVAKLSEDINGDGSVNMADVIIIAVYFNTMTSESSKKCDLNDDGSINMADVLKLALEFNTTTASVI